ncbi:helix-turn-helix domain-containing protein [Bacillus timonensis]|nr:helix-turn-helix domain-containing protein [Bacillus timonensis]
MSKNNKKITDLEIAKIIMDPKRKSILDIASNGPVTVNQIAEELGEKPSRLYYHVKKLEEAELLELVDTRQHGNLIEKYYKANKDRGIFQLDRSLLSEHPEAVMAQIMNVLEPGLKLLGKGVKEGKENNPEYQVNLTINFSEKTGREWVESMDRIRNAVGGELSKEDDTTTEEAGFTAEELDRKSRYAYVTLSYRIDDAKDL